MMDFDEMVREMRYDDFLPAAVREKCEETLSGLFPENTGLTVVPFRKRGKRAVAAAAVVLLLAAGTATVGAAIYSHFSRGFKGELHIDEETQLAAEESGLSAYPATLPETDDVISCTENGVTVTAQQILMDSYMTSLSFEVAGFHPAELDAGATPSFGRIVIEIDGKPVNWNGNFFNGIVAGPDGMGVYEDGSALAQDENGVTIQHFFDEDGNLEFQAYILGNESSDFSDKEISVRFEGLGIIPERAEYQNLLDGVWELHWTLNGGGTSKKEWHGEYQIPEMGMTILSAEVTPLSLRTTFRIDEKIEGYDYEKQLEFPLELTGARMKDGTDYLYMMDGGGGSGWLDEEHTVFETWIAVDRILDPDDVAALAFKDWKGAANADPLDETYFYFVPVD